MAEAERGAAGGCQFVWVEPDNVAELDRGPQQRLAEAVRRPRAMTACNVSYIRS